MIIKHSNDQYDYNLEIDYNMLMGGWSNNLKDLLHRESMSELMFLLNTEYKNRKSIYPAKKDIFNCLKETAFKDINVIIVNCVPNLNARSNGLAFGNIDSSYDNFDSELVQLFNDMAAQGSVVSKTINITGATGTAGLTAPNRQIITNIGWTITG